MLEVLQGDEQTEFVGVGSDQHRHPRDPARGDGCHRVDGQHLGSGHRPGEPVGAEAHIGRRTFQPGRWQCPQALRHRGRVGAARLGGVVVADGLRGRPVRLRLAGTALQDGGSEQPLRRGRDEVVAHRHRSGRLAGDGHLLRVAAEAGDVVVHPPQRRLLVGQAVVAGFAIAAQRRMGQEAQRSQPVVDRDDDDVAPRGEPAGVVDVGAAVEEPAPVDPHHDRPSGGGRRAGRRPDVEVEAVLTGGPSEVRVEGGVLDAAHPGLGGVAYSVPGRRWLRGLPAQRADRRRGVRDAAEQPEIRADDAAYRSRGGLDHGRIGGRRRFRTRPRATAATAPDHRHQGRDERRRGAQWAANRSAGHRIGAYGSLRGEGIDANGFPWTPRSPTLET